MTANPQIFLDYFEGEEEIFSPFITFKTRKWGKSLTLKASFIAAFILILSFVFSFFPSTNSLSLALLVSVYFFAGIPSLIDAIEDIFNFNINIDVLMTLAAFSSIIIGSPMEGALLLVLFSLSGSMEDMVSSKAKSSLRSLHKLSPTRAWWMNPEGAFIQKSLKDIQVGDTILIKSGEIIPLDGIVVEGISSVNLVHLTGENLPITKKVGDTVPAGGRNLEGFLQVKVSHLSQDSTLSRIIQLVTQAEDAKPILAQWFERLSRSYAIAIISLSLFFSVFMTWWFSIPFLGYEGGLYRAIAFLIAASPCALVIAIPIAYLSALGIAAKKGILLKGGITLDALAAAKVIAFDKTGTLTTGQLVCTFFEGSDEELSHALALEINSHHPIAKAIQDFAEKKNLKPSKIVDFRTLAGYGVEAKTPSGDTIYVGNTDGIERQKWAGKHPQIEQIKASGDLIAIMTLNDRVLLFRFMDLPRAGAKETLAALKKRGLKLLMLTGDHLSSARKIAHEMLIDDYRAELKPEDKLKAVAEIAEKEALAYVGDGMNDAPALARATIGISMGRGASHAAIEAADVVLLQDNIDRLDWLFNKAHATQRIVKQNLTIATLAIIIAAFPALFGYVPLWLAVVMHEGGTVIVGLNGLRLLRN